MRKSNRSKKKISGLLAAAVIAGTASMPQAQVLNNENVQIDENITSVEVTTGSALTTTGAALIVDAALVNEDENFFDASTMEAVSITTTKEVGRFTINPAAEGETAVSVDASSKTADDGKSFTKRLKLGGAGNSSKRSLSFQTKGKAKVTIYAMSSTGSADRTLTLVNDTNEVKGSITGYGASLKVQTIDIAEAGTYSLASTSGGINIYGVLIEETPTYKEMTLHADLLPISSITTSQTIGDFKLVGASGSSIDIDASAQISTDGEAFAQRIKLGGTGNAEKRSIHFTMADKGSVEIYAMSGSSSADRKLNLYKMDGTLVGEVNAYGKTLEKGTIQVPEAGDYYLASPASGVNVCKVVVIEGEKPAEVVRPDWSTVAAPVLTSVDYKEGATDTIEIKFNLETSTEAADKATVVIKDAEGNIVTEILVGKSINNEKSATFKPSASGTYSVQVLGQRNDVEEAKPSNTMEFAFSLPLTASEASASNKGGGDVLLKWTGVKEATSYRVEYKKVDDAEYVQGMEVAATDELEALLKGLEVDVRYNFRIVAVRGNDESVSEALNFKVMDRIEREWAATYFGQSSNKDLNKATVIDQENLTVKLESCTSKADGSIDKKGGKFTTFHDGITYYYTEIDAANENFELTATFAVDYINPTADGQEGFGIVAMDALGEHGVNSKNHYTNSASVIATKFEEKVNGVVTASGKDVMGTRMVSGITPEVLAGGDSAIAAAGKNVSRGYKYEPEDIIKAGDIYTLTLKKTNTGYHMIVNGDESTERIMYGVDKLLQLDQEKMYVGFAVARGCNVTVSDISMTTTDPATDPEGIPEPEEFDYLKTKIDAPAYTGNADYNFVFRTNLPGLLNVKDAAGNVVIKDQRIVADTDFAQAITLDAGKNDFKVAFKPDEDSRTAAGLRIESYEEVVLDHSVTLQAFEGKSIYVSPQGTASGEGTEASPTDIYTASKYVKAGQEILLASGAYNMTAPLFIERGVDGTADAKITMRTVDGERAIFNFKNASAGMQLWGSYWHIVGIDVCNTPGNVKGLQVAGHYNTIERVETYNNGDTGLQISGISSESKDKWPSNNLILNCSSYDNIDPGENNADGFAAKITCGEGNIFRGCAAYNNLDDGWDLFSKIESGPIGAVIVEDCIAFNNGTLTTGYGNGDGNGFKLGGDGIAVPHILRNSISFNNNTNGITSNSDPAVQLYNNTAFGNKGSNINLYGKGTADRTFIAENNISMAGGAADIYELKTLEREDNYFFDGGVSKNVLGTQLKNDIFESVAVTTYKMARKEDGSIDMGDLLKLNSKAPEGVGANLSGETVKPEVPQTNRTWEFAKGDFAEKTIQSSSETIEGVIIDATNGKFNTAGRSNAQINPGTLVKIPVSGPTEFTFKHGYDAGTLVFTDEAGNVEKYAYTNDKNWKTPTVVLSKATKGYVTLSWEDGSSFYIESLTTKEAAQVGMTLEVGPSATYKTVQSALNAIDYTPTEETRVTISIAPGIYEEEVTVTKPFVTFKNADPTKEVKITYDKASGHDSDPSKNKGTQDSASVTIAATAEGFEAYDITFENSYNLGQENLGDNTNDRKQTQAVAVVTFADRIIFDNCKFIGRQDTLFLKGSSKGQMTPEVNEARVYLKDCYIEGTVDYIFGDATAVFENCQLHMAYYTNGGHYTAANTNLGTLGYVFNNCELTIDEAYRKYIDPATGQFKIENGKPVKNIDLGRPWQADHTYPYFGSQTVFNNCKMDPAIKSEGWSTWDANTVTNKIRYMEYNSMDLSGNPIDMNMRPDWVRILQNKQAAAYNTVNVLWGSDGWNPSKGTALTEIQVADITLNTYKVEVPQGETTTLTATVLPVQAQNKAYTWQSSDTSIATVDANGKVTTLKEGTVRITATTEENNCAVSAEIKVIAKRTATPIVKMIGFKVNDTILPGDVLKGFYEYMSEADNAIDCAKVQWYLVDPVTGDEILVQEGREAFDREYKVTASDIGYYVKFVVIPETTTTYGDTGRPIFCALNDKIIAKPDYEVPEVYVRETFSSFMANYADVTNFKDAATAKWLGANVPKGGISDQTGFTLLHDGTKTTTDKAAWKIVDTDGKASDSAEFNGNSAIAANIEYQNDAGLLVYNADTAWTNVIANARVRFSPLATGFSGASYWDMYINYDAKENSGYKVRISRGGNTKSGIVTLYKVVNGVEAMMGEDKTTLANALPQNSGAENPFFRVEMKNDQGKISVRIYFEGDNDTEVNLSFVDEAPLAGTVAFEHFGKTGCPIIDMLTVEQILDGSEPSVDTEAPILGYTGETTIRVKYASTFIMPEVTATDNVDEKIVVNYVITNKKGEVVEKINTKSSGTYTITYTAKDAAGNEATALQIKVIVANSPSSDDDLNSNSSSSNTLPSTPSEDEVITDALNKGEAPTVTIKDNKVNVSEEVMKALLESNLALNITVDKNIAITISAPTLKEQGEAKLEIKAAAPSKEVSDKIAALVKADEKMTAIAPEQLQVTVAVTSDEKVESFKEPIKMQFALNKEQIKNAKALTAVRYEAQADGTLKAVKIGGQYNEKTGTYEFLTDKVGTFGLVEAEGLVKVTLVVGDKAAVVNGEEVVNDVAAEITSERTMLPVRFVAESLGAKVGYKFGRVTLTMDDQTIDFKVGENLEAYNVTPYIKEGRTYISARWVAEQLGANVLWVPSSQTVEIVK